MIKVRTRREVILQQIMPFFIGMYLIWITANFTSDRNILHLLGLVCVGAILLKIYSYFLPKLKNVFTKIYIYAILLISSIFYIIDVRSTGFLILMVAIILCLYHSRQKRRVKSVEDLLRESVYM